MSEADLTNEVEAAHDEIDALRATVLDLRKELIAARKELDDAALAVARLVLEKKQMLEDHEAYKQAIMNRIAEENITEYKSLLDIAISNGII